MRPTLVIALSALMGVWRDKIAKYFETALLLKVFHGDPAHLSDMTQKERTLKPDGLVEWCHGLSDSSPQTARTVVLTSYQTWLPRTLLDDDTTVIIDEATAACYFQQVIRSRSRSYGWQGVKLATCAEEIQNTVRKEYQAALGSCMYLMLEDLSFRSGKLLRYAC
ncbi:hypothetical protein ASPSYDRAFT_93029 [Aspergillus sydowii CBS 593.65]|uniref:Uncharacterized protein n=1 Tax=Aspergillus sydowii CBS 593.65 TaxID=1036612 RepID=A0A1L9T6C4_9EURO|nr:uncharacterized protein ASPSYDRAFT_93029 [Aspergillus sydowii CBS 593.65]OJJ55000.1 hypothetical protein ASPSYDRAFT_93029 [Aspergillus sydowii CBS 593.65]